MSTPEVSRYDQKKNVFIIDFTCSTISKGNFTVFKVIMNEVTGGDMQVISEKKRL